MSAYGTQQALGICLHNAALTASKTISTGDVFRIPTGDLDITLD